LPFDIPTTNTFCAVWQVTCFSVAKWVHLVRGDDGLVLFFQRVFQLLKPGGR